MPWILHPLIAFRFHLSPYVFRIGQLLIVSVSSWLYFHGFSEHFFCSILLICDRLSVQRRTIFKFSLPMPLSGGPAHSSKSERLWCSHVWPVGPCLMLCTRVYIYVLPQDQNFNLPYTSIPDKTKPCAPLTVLKTQFSVAVWAYSFVLLINVCLFIDMLVLLNSVDLYKVNVSACLHWVVWGLWQRYMQVRLHLTKMLLWYGSMTVMTLLRSASEAVHKFKFTN